MNKTDTTHSRELEEFIDGLRLRHFKGEEFTPYWTRTREGVPNGLPSKALWPNIVHTLIVADELRERAGCPLTVLSSYRSPAYNRAVGGEPNSFHMRFMALDLSGSVGARRLHQIAKDLRGKEFLIGNEEFEWRGGIGLYVRSNFIHIDCRNGPADWTGN